MEQILLTVSETAKMMGAGQSTIWKWVKEGNFPKPIKIGGATRWRITDISDFIEQAQEAA